MPEQSYTYKTDFKHFPKELAFEKIKNVKLLPKSFM